MQYVPTWTVDRFLLTLAIVMPRRRYNSSNVSSFSTVDRRACERSRWTKDTITACTRQPQIIRGRGGGRGEGERRGEERGEEGREEGGGVGGEEEGGGGGGRGEGRKGEGRREGERSRGRGRGGGEERGEGEGRREGEWEGRRKGEGEEEGGGGGEEGGGGGGERGKGRGGGRGRGGKGEGAAHQGVWVHCLFCQLLGVRLDISHIKLCSGQHKTPRLSSPVLCHPVEYNVVGKPPPRGGAIEEWDRIHTRAHVHTLDTSNACMHSYVLYTCTHNTYTHALTIRTCI